MESFTGFEAHRIALLLACLLVAVVAAIVWDARFLAGKEPKAVKASLYQYAVVVAFIAFLTALFGYNLAFFECRAIPDDEVKAVVDRAVVADLKLKEKDAMWNKLNHVLDTAAAETWPAGGRPPPSAYFACRKNLATAYEAMQFKVVDSPKSALVGELIAVLDNPEQKISSADRASPYFSCLDHLSIALETIP